MPEAKTVVNFNNMSEFSTTVYDAAFVPDEIWRELQLTQFESLKSYLPQEEWDRAAELVRSDDFDTYRDRRVNPNHQAGRDGWNKEQIFRRPMVAVSFDRSGEVVGGVLTADNSSGKKGASKPAWLAEAWAKMLTPPGLNVPGIGNKRHVHLREAFAHPDVQEALDVEDDTAVVSGIVMGGIYFSIAQRHGEQALVEYIVPGDPADSEQVNIAEVLRMTKTGDRPNTITGFAPETDLVRVKTRVGQAMADIMALPEASSIFSNPVRRVLARSENVD